MLHWSEITRYLVANRARVPSTVWQAARAEAIARYSARLQSGRADTELNFIDLFERCEAALTPH